MAIYMCIDGMQGNVTTKNYEGWINCIDFDFSGITNQVSQDIGNETDRVMHHPTFGDVSVRKSLDQSSIPLFEHAHSRKVIPQVQIHHVVTSNPVFTYSKLIIKNAIVSHYSELSSDILYSSPREFIVFSYMAIERTYIPRKSDNTAGSPVVSGYDLSEGEAM